MRSVPVRGFIELPVSIVKNDPQERVIDLQPAVILDKAQLPKLIHEETYPATGGANHLRQCSLRDLSNDFLRPLAISVPRNEQQRAGQTLLAGIEKLID